MSEYKVYTTAHDQEIRAEALSGHAYHPDAQYNYTRQFEINRGLIEHMHNHIQDLIKQGDLDPENTVVSFLLDNSRSTYKDPAYFAITLTSIAALALERSGVKTEILGYTTSEWKGGEPRQEWLAAGKPREPGRLNSLRHIVYKTPNQSWEEAHQNLCVALNTANLKENIDGEAIQWAEKRLRTQPQKNKLLIVLSDESPVDDSTLAVNRENILMDHHRAVVDEVNTKSPVALSSFHIRDKGGSSTYYSTLILRPPYERRFNVSIEQNASLIQEVDRKYLQIKPEAADGLLRIIAARKSPLPAPQAS